MIRNQIFILSTILLATACGGGKSAKLAEYEMRDRRIAHQLEVFDDLDFNVFSNQKWDELKRSHAPDIVVHWPDNHTTKGLDVHINDLKAIFVFAPDTRIQEHPIKIGNGEWTAVYGIIEGTFTRPMPDGQQPTGKSFRIPMATFGRWNQDGVMSEEYLFWDNAAFMKQIGL